MRGKIKIVGNGMPNTTKIFLDDKDVSNFVIGVYINFGIDRLPLVTLELLGDVELSNELAAILTATQKLGE